ncbi:ABC transporter permease [Cohaesibacter gelatinilyticus]|uniref:Peptide/nickel transport system permease protein n=1 Tax=Cohaesibacter gelatinilyticus TaxID=372072 RepID=A0A285NF28_9HYPH|nr:ABC transporter permease [Cohaesibacter gelatinilyticus]SNZ07878.1 peptide/nickel transport system permease protein [Cohaesibacter gelatinilyticus]
MSDISKVPAQEERGALADFIHRLRDNDVWYSFWHTPMAMISAAIAIVMIMSAVFAPVLAPQNPFDLSVIDLLDSNLPPAWMEEGDPRYLLGTDDQGRDILSTVLYGSRISLLVGFAAVVLSLIVGVGLGLISGYVGGRTDAIIMRIADIQLSFPAILIALLIDGVVRTIMTKESHESLALYVIIFAIAISGWVQYARTVRSSVMTEKVKEYVQAGQVIGLGSFTIMIRHILPNVLGPVFVIGTIHLALAIIIEATLSFLGVGLPPTTPSLGTLIRVGNEYLFSGEWWITIFPGMTLVILALAVNLFGDWLRDAMNPKLQ